MSTPPVQAAVASAQQGPEQDHGFFYQAVSDSKWYENLERHGSCLRLLELLTKHPTLIHGLGPKNMTVLHKGVEHGCVALVRFVLVDMFDDSGHCKCGRHGAGAPGLTREQLLRKTCSYGSTAVNMAVVSGSPKMVVLLDWAIRMCSAKSTIKRSSTLRPTESNLVFRDATAMYSSFEQRIKELGHEQTRADESISATDEEVPNVKDEDLSILLHARNSEVESKVISVIEGVLGDPGDENRHWMAMVKDSIAKDVDFEFVPLAHVFLHFLSSIRCEPSENHGFYRFQNDVMKRIFEACSGDGDGEDGKDGESGAMLKTLFNILDPRGRPFLHVAYEFHVVGFIPMDEHFLLNLDQLMGVDISRSIKSMFWNVTDGAGGTIFHLMGIYNKILDRPFEFQAGSYIVNVTRNLLPASLPQRKKLDALKRWCFPELKGFELGLTPVEFALILNSQDFLAKIWPSDGSEGLLSASIYESATIYEGVNPVKVRIADDHPLRLAAALGRTAIIENMLQHHIKFASLKDPGLQDWNLKYVPALHYAAAYGRVEAIQSILKLRVYDPMVQHERCGTALHVLLDKKRFPVPIKNYHDALLCQVLPNLKRYDPVKYDLLNLRTQQDETPRIYSSNDISCISLLLQAGIDIWTPHCSDPKVFPSPGPMANDQARKWWFERVVTEVVALKTSVSYAANATSVVAALVTTASFIGPFQPPLGYGDVDGFVQTNRSPLRVYLVCNNLSFYFSIASILMSLLPAIPMPKESLYDELLRGQRCLKGAALMLLTSIICILISFSSASIAVVSPVWHEREVVVSCVIFGGVICVVVLMIYIIRLLRMMFHKHDRVRRMFARYMYF